MRPFFDGTRAANLAFVSGQRALAVILPTDHRLAALKAIRPQDLAVRHP